MGSEPLEIERRYLLAGWPEIPAGAEVVEIEQGWVPETEPPERLRHARTKSGERWVRTFKRGEGLTRVEIEDDVSPEEFARVWPLTQACRVRKRRHRVDAGALTWELDDYYELGLYVAEVELPTEDTRVEIPGWLEPRVVREVTEDRRYSSLSIARHGVPSDASPHRRPPNG